MKPYGSHKRHRMGRPGRRGRTVPIRSRGPMDLAVRRSDRRHERQAARRELVRMLEEIVAAVRYRWITVLDPRVRA